jgi:EpsI family protein
MGHPILVSGTPHKIQGYVFFIGALFLLFGFASFLERHKFKPFFLRRKVQTDFSASEHVWFTGLLSYRKFIVVTFLLLLPLIANARLSFQTPMPLLQKFSSFPSQLGDWQGMEIASNEWRPKVVGATSTLARGYSDSDGNEVKIFLAYLPIQMQGHELVFHANRIIPVEFIAAKRQVKNWQLGNLHLKTNVLISNESIHQKILIYWYKNTNHYCYNRYLAKISMIVDSFWLNQSNGTVFVMKFTNGSNGSEYNQSRVEDFLGVFLKELVEYLPS